MLRVLIFLGIVLAGALGFAWLADRPGTVSIDWMGYQIEVTAMIAMMAVAALVVAVMLTWWILKAIIRSPQMMGGYFASRKRDRGYDALSNGLVAAGSGDAKAAARYSKQAKKLAPDAPLTQVLSATSADLAGDADAKRLAYRKMLDDPKTQLLGLRGLYLDAVSDDDEEAARHYADQAAALAPALAWAGEAQFEDQVQRGDWPAARSVLERNLQGRLVTKAQRNRLRAVLLTAEATDREAGEPEPARALALEAHKLAPDLVPAAAVAGRLLIRASKMTQASKVIEATWKQTPHPELAEVYLYVRPGDAVADRVKRARKLAQLCAHTAEGELTLARALMEAGHLDEARERLTAHIGEGATQRVCLLMAEIEEKDGGDTAAARGWMARALRAKRDAAWVADGYVSATWEPVSPLSGRVDAFEWKVPLERYTGHDPVAIPADAMNEDGQVMLPARLPGVELPSVAGAGVATVAAGLESETVDAEMLPSDANAPTDAKALEASSKEESADDTPEAPSAEETKPAAKDAEVAPAPEAKDAKDDAKEASQPAEEKPAQVIDVAPANDDTKTAEAPKPAANEAKPGKAGDDDYSGLPGGHAPDDPGEGADGEDTAYDGNPQRRFRLF
ncbi:MAG: heme biosynthesis protein HemY [Devosiaceae bacterium]|nr:heme biosynthesis protein HemY [Devosiaceae bacterium MH13]